MTRPSAPVAIAVVLPLLLALVVAGIGVVARLRGADGSDPAPPDTRPLAVVPIDAPEASSPSCTSLLAGLDGDLPADGATLPRRALAAPAPAGVRAWAAAPEPAVLRCGLPRPAELTPTAALLEIDGVRWLQLDDGTPNPQALTYVAVDRPVYVVLTVPTGVGSAPLQAVSDTVRTTLPAAPVVVR
ncbi:MAG TPA: DUF3515 domain-containing protein [Pseudonocardia sp.]